MGHIVMPCLLEPGPAAGSGHSQLTVADGGVSVQQHSGYTHDATDLYYVSALGSAGAQCAGESPGGHNDQLRSIFDRVLAHGNYNACGARVRIPSGLCIEAWARYLQDYTPTSSIFWPTDGP